MAQLGTTKVAVVTGGNKGIGYAIVKGLCERYQGKVYLTARDQNRGQSAVNKLKELGHNPVFYQLDINDQKSINDFRDYVRRTDGGIDILINNAAIAFKTDATEPFSQQAEETIQVNYFGTLRVCETLFPILRPHARVVNLSSSAGHLSRIPSQELRDKLRNSSLTVKKLNDLMNQFVSDAKEDKNVERGWGNSAYVVSKVGVSALTIIQQKNFDNEPEMRDISVNSVHPGYVDTDMTSHRGVLTIEQGAKAPLFLALEPHTLRGQYVWSNSVICDWTASGVPGYIQDDD